MSDKTGIEWTDATWNPLAGCSLKSPGCTHCYAMPFANRLLDKPGSHYHGTTKIVNGKPVWTGKINLAPDHILLQPLSWKRPRRIFVNSMSDLFHEDVPDDWIDLIFAIMALCPQHTFQILTKRSDRMRGYMNREHPLIRIHHLAAADLDGKLAAIFRPWTNIYSAYVGATWPLPNVWLGVSIEDQKRAEERIPDLLGTPAAIRFLSCEPLLGPLELVSACTGYYFFDCLRGRKYHDADNGTSENTESLDWVIVGGESGPAARPMHPDWLLSIRDQCQNAGVPFFFKQWGEWFGVDAPESFDAKTEFIGWNDRKFSGDQLHDFGDGVVALRAGKKFLGNWLMGRKYEDFPSSLPAAA